MLHMCNARCIAAAGALGILHHLEVHERHQQQAQAQHDQEAQHAHAAVVVLLRQAASFWRLSRGIAEAASPRQQRSSADWILPSIKHRQELAAAWRVAHQQLRLSAHGRLC